jgi:hypothetical protein
MMPDDPARLQTVRQMLRLRYNQPSSPNLPGLKALWEQVATGATEAVELTGQAFEGGNATGQIVFTRLGYLQAVQDVWAEMDPCSMPCQPPGVRFADFSGPILAT